MISAKGCQISPVDYSPIGDGPVEGPDDGRARVFSCQVVSWVAVCWPGSAQRRLSSLALVLAFASIALALVVFSGCGEADERAGGGDSKGSTALVADREKSDGEGIPEFVVAAFTEALLRCDYKKTLGALKQHSRLFAPGSQSALFGQYGKKSYTGPPDPRDESVRSRENPPPSREQELASLLGLFPGGRLVEDASEPPRKREGEVLFPGRVADSESANIRKRFTRQGFQRHPVFVGEGPFGTGVA